MFHARIYHVYIQGKPFSDVGITASTKCVKAINEVDFFVLGWQWERLPLSLLWQCIDAGITGEKAVFDMRLVFNLSIAI